MDALQVLIVDDSRDIARAYQTVLTHIGFKCEIAYSAKDAFARLFSQVPDLVLLDLHLGHEIGGEDILHQIRSNPRFDGTRVIVITAYPEVAKLVNQLADLVLIKPIEMDQLVAFSKRIGSFEISPKPFPFRDPITQLFNKEFFQTQLEYAFARGSRRKEFLFAVILLRIQLQEITENQILPETWALLIREAAEQLSRQMRAVDTTARFGTWEFAILVEDLKQPEDLELICNRIAESMAAPLRVGNEQYPFRLVFGTAIYLPNYKKPENMLETASQALSRAEGFLI